MLGWKAILYLNCFPIYPFIITRERVSEKDILNTQRERERGGEEEKERGGRLFTRFQVKYTSIEVIIFKGIRLKNIYTLIVIKTTI